MVYIKWQCPICKDIRISNSWRHHEMNMCKCGKTGVDLEEYGCRYMTNYFDEFKKSIKKYNYNFFEELVVGMEKQGFLDFIKVGDRLHLNYDDVFIIRELEDKIVESLK